ncbi:Protein of unknown function DUF247, plant [Cynara cardunculus var. scolymus]|uniref:Uncharacterized protein n=1 Tax=Cynara cardunculus var. scolymus TaxID=59895 RepID=A0A103XBB1_CYNCS|nr:Protein of unknown function DUF247, plant [Cynara cardunculus var. scolymus]
MATIDVKKGDVETKQMIQVLVEKEKERRNHRNNNAPSIYIVDSILRNLSPNSFEPCVVAIGPLHKEDEKLQDMESHKVTYLLDLFLRLPSMPDRKMDECIERVYANVEQIRACYAGKMEAYDDCQVAKMMVIDGCFVLEFILRKFCQPADAKPSGVSVSRFHSVEELTNAGVNFKRNQDKRWPLAMEFKASWFPCFGWAWGKPTFTMPVLYIEDHTESVLRNLIAYEQCSPLSDTYITSYAVAMGMLVDTQEDIVKMVDSKVLINNLGTNRDAANMINNICENVVLQDFCYSQQCNQVGSYYDHCWPKYIAPNMAGLRRTYFSSPWNFVALVAGIILFGLTVIQTYYTEIDFVEEQMADNIHPGLVIAGNRVRKRSERIMIKNYFSKFKNTAANPVVLDEKDLDYHVVNPQAVQSNERIIPVQETDTLLRFR